jgi:hypothetical protein
MFAQRSVAPEPEKNCSPIACPVREEEINA